MINHIKTASSLADLLDNKFNIFGWKFGIDPLLGLIPGVGDFISFVLGLYIVWIGIKMELPQSKLFKMIRNIVLDFGVGLIPFFGDVFDFAFKSNIMNLEIIKQHAKRNIIEGEIVE